MLSIYDVSLEVARDAIEMAKRIQRMDANLASQISRAATAIPLNIAEGSYSRGGNRNARYHTAMGSAGEVRAVLDVAEGLGWIERDRELRGKLNRIVGTLVRVLKLR